MYYFNGLILSLRILRKISNYIYYREKIKEKEDAMLRNVISIKDDNEESIQKAIREILRTKRKGHEIAIDVSRIKDRKRKADIIKRLSNY
jgi:hypothetical protein